MDMQEVTSPDLEGSSLWPEAASEDIEKAQKHSGGNASLPTLRMQVEVQSARSQELSKADGAFFWLGTPGASTYFCFS